MRCSGTLADVLSKTDFLVGVRITDGPPKSDNLRPLMTSSAEGFSSSRGDQPLSILFRTHKGPLASGDISTDGNVLVALKKLDGVQIFAHDARLIRCNVDELVSSESPVNVNLQTASDREDVTVIALKSTTLKVLAKKVPLEVTIDGKQVQTRISGRFIVLNIDDGEHSASVRY